MGSLGVRKPHAVLVPYPAQGHVNPFMQLAKLLQSRGFHITFVNSEFNHRRLIRSKGPDSVKGSEDFRFETIPDGLPPSDCDATQNIPALSYSIQKTCLAPFIELLTKLNSSALDVPPVTCIVTDGAMGFAIDAAEKLGIPGVQFWTASACGFLAYLHYSDLVKRGIVPFGGSTFCHLFICRLFLFVCFFGNYKILFIPCRLYIGCANFIFIGICVWMGYAYFP